MSILLKCCIKSTLWLLTCHTQEWICIHKRAGRQTILVWQHTRCRGCCNPWSAMLRLQSSFFIHEVKGIPINSHGHLSHSPATNHSMCSTHNTHISPYWLDLLYTFNVCVPYEGDQHIYLIPIVWSIMAHEDNANINSMSTLHSSPFLTNPACKHHWSFQSQRTPQTVQHETHPPW